MRHSRRPLSRDARTGKTIDQTQEELFADRGEKIGFVHSDEADKEAVRLANAIVAGEIAAEDLPMSLVMNVRSELQNMGEYKFAAAVLRARDRVSALNEVRNLIREMLS
jgi:hypothetical protein